MSMKANESDDGKYSWKCFSEHFENCIPYLSKMLGNDTLY